MSEKDLPTGEYESLPPESLQGPKLFAHLVGAILVEKLEPVTAKLDKIANDTDQLKSTGGETTKRLKAVIDAVDNLHSRLKAVESDVEELKRAVAWTKE